MYTIVTRCVPWQLFVQMHTCVTALVRPMYATHLFYVQHFVKNGLELFFNGRKNIFAFLQLIIFLQSTHGDLFKNGSAPNFEIMHQLFQDTLKSNILFYLSFQYLSPTMETPPLIMPFF